MDRPRVIRDPVLDYVSLPDPLARLVDTPLFQRLRRVRQNGLTLSVYPSATGTRFEHSLGAMHLAMQVWDAVWRNSGEDPRTALLEELRAAVPSLPQRERDLVPLVRDAIGAVALLHDIGHPPFSHALEEVFEPREGELTLEAAEIREEFGGPFHEFAGRCLVGHLRPDGEAVPGPLHQAIADPPLADLTLRISTADEGSGSALGVLHSIVAGQYDIDRTDYLARDNQRMGTEFGEIDRLRLIDAFELQWIDEASGADGTRGFGIAPGIRGRSAVETLLTQRVQTHRWVLFHARVIGTNLALSRGLDIAWKLANDQGRGFDALKPNLNYLDPTVSDLRPPARPQDEFAPAGAGGRGQEPLFDVTGPADLQERLVTRVRASVDDGTVTEFLKASGLQAELLLERPDELDNQLRRSLAELLAYTSAALLRSKNFLIAWKTDEDYQDIAATVSERLVASLRSAYEELRGEFGSDPAAVSHIDGLEDEDLAWFGHSHVRGLNHVVKALLSDPRHIDRLEGVLGEAQRSVMGTEGWWALRYNPFRAVGSSVVVYHGDDPVDLAKRSPYVHALRDVEQAATTLHAFFFLPYPQSFAVWGSAEMALARKELRRAFTDRFPEFVRAHWAEYVRPSVREFINEGGQGD